MKREKRPLFLILLAVLALTSAWCPAAVNEPVHLPDGNRLRNSSFELNPIYNGAAMRQGSESIYFARIGRGLCAALPLEGWLAEGPSAAGATLINTSVHSGLRALQLAPAEGKKLSIFSCPEVQVEAGPVILSAWVESRKVKGTLELVFTQRSRNGASAPKIIGRKKVNLPGDTRGWTRVELAATAPENAGVMVRFNILHGQATIDDVQLESGTKATAFDVRRDEALELSFKKEASAHLPFWTTASAGIRRLEIKNASRREQAGTLELNLGPWSNPDRNRAATLPQFKLAPGSAQEIPVNLAGLEPDAYIIHAVLKNNGHIEFDGARQINVATPIGGAVSNHMLTGRGAIRFGLFPDNAPGPIFGVGNGKLTNGWEGCTGNWSGGWPLALFAVPRSNGFTCGRGRMSYPDQAYLFAAAGVPFHRMESENIFFGAPKNAAFIVPGTKNGIDLWNPDGFKFNLDRAARIGRENAANPGVVSYQMANEVFFTLKNGLCPSTAADTAFRQWCRERHGRLEQLNARWGTAYASWDEVEQPLSAGYAAEMGRNQDQGGTDWLSAFGRLPAEAVKRMNAPSGRGMDWLRWRTASTLKFYAAFKNEAKKYDRKTLYSTNLCWPNFRPQMYLPFLREMDHALVDAMYTSGLGGLGNPKEMLEILEQTESASPGKPIWGAEIYVQPGNPAEFPALQNWGLVAHGMSNILVFGWGQTSDHGIVKKTRAWEAKNAHPMWMLIDWDGTRLPVYYTCQRSLEEIKTFNRKYDAATLARSRTDTAIYLSNDTGEYVCLETGDKPWSSLWTRTHTTLTYLLRMEGIRFDIVDDATLPDRPGPYTRLIVPASYLLSQEAAARMASFAANGGVVVLAGASGIADPWLKKYPVLGGPAWAELNWQAPRFTSDPVLLNFVGADYRPVEPTRKSSSPDYVKVKNQFRGRELGTMAGGKPLRDTSGKLVGWTRPWGKGCLIAYGVIPDSYDANPHPPVNQLVWIRQLIARAGLRHAGRWASSAPVYSSEGFTGEGQPVVEVVVRERRGKEDSERFVFLFNQGGAGSGRLEFPLPDGDWKGIDALTGAPIGLTRNATGAELALNLKPWEYRVFRLSRK